MQNSLSNTSIDDILSTLANTLREERGALTKVDTEGIQRTAAAKLALSEALMQRRQELTDSHRKLLSELQTDVRHNLILLVHARDCVQNRLAILTGRPPGVGSLQHGAAESVRLDLRG